MDGGDAARPEVRGLLFAQRLGVIFRAEVDLDRREHINHDRALHQLYRPLRIDAVRRRIDLEMRARDIGGRQGGGDGRARTAYRLPSRKKHLTPFDLFIFSTWDDIIPIGISQSPFTRGRSEERREGKEWFSTCRTRGLPL